jgi:Fic family protein
MLIPPKYSLTPVIVELLQSIEASREVIDSITIPPEVESNIRRRSTLKSSLFSARIEGNDLTLADLDTPSKTQKKAEVFNILKALGVITRRSKKDLTEDDILELHKITTEGLFETPGKIRTEMNAIFNSAGIAIYMPPPPRQIPSLLTKLIKFTKSPRERFTPIKAALVHYSFEKIHPFLDGNGRVGRLLLQKVLIQGGYGMKGLLSLEEYLDNHRSEYYRALEEPEKDVSDYIVFMLEALNVTALQAKKLVLEKREIEVTDYLLPRRAEIFNIIKDQKIVNFDQIRRRFLAVNARTLRYDLKKLADAGLIKKLGTTKGVYYQANLKLNVPVI